MTPPEARLIGSDEVRMGMVVKIVPTGGYEYRGKVISANDRWIVLATYIGEMPFRRNGDYAISVIDEALDGSDTDDTE